MRVSTLSIFCLPAVALLCGSRPVSAQTAAAAAPTAPMGGEHSRAASTNEHASPFLEDPFVTRYRRMFFSVFEGKTEDFEKGMKELDALLAKNPSDARALVWHGNGLMVRAGLKRFGGDRVGGQNLLLQSKTELDRAVSLDPNNVNILAMRAVTLYVASQYWPASALPPGSWQAVIHDLEKSRKIIGPARMRQLSVHARGQILTELATAYTKTNQVARARAMWQEVVRSVPGSSFEAAAREQMRRLASTDAKRPPSP